MMTDLTTKIEKELIANAPESTNQDAEEILEKANEEQAQPKKRKARAPKAREIEELINIPFSKMTDKEKEIYAKHLEEENLLLANKNKELNTNVLSFTEQLRIKESEFSKVLQRYRKILTYIQDATEVHTRNITALLYGGIQ